MISSLGKFKKISGFSLIELSLALVVIASLSVVAITKYTAGKQNERQLQAYYDLKKIKVAIDAYVAANRRYPCPASLNMSESDTSGQFGVGRRDLATGNCLYGVNDYGIFHGKDEWRILADGSTEAEDVNRFMSPINYVDARAIDKSADVIMGAPPCKDIGLPADCMFDPYGNRYSYAVVPELARINACSKYAMANSDPSQDQDLVRLKILKGIDLNNYSTAIDNYVNGYAYSGTPPDPDNEADFALIFYGADGFGAYPNTGGDNNDGNGDNRIKPSLMSGSDPALSASYIGDNTYQEINHNIHWQEQGGSSDTDMDEYFLAPDRALGSGFTFGDIVVFGRSEYLSHRVCVTCNSLCGKGVPDEKVIAVTDFGVGAMDCSNSLIETKCVDPNNDLEQEGNGTGDSDEAPQCSSDPDCEKKCNSGPCQCNAGQCIDYHSVPTNGYCTDNDDCQSKACSGNHTCK